MRIILLAAVIALGLSLSEAASGAENPLVVVETSMGKITVELWADKAPVTVKNFLQYVDKGFYDGTIFHRVIDGFMIQGGGLTKDMARKKGTLPPIKNEARADVKNKLGTLAMARTADVDSATAQFFINVKDNPFLDHKDNTDRGFGYAVFGKVVKGMDVVDKIKKVKTGVKAGRRDVPLEPVVIKSAKRVKK